MEIQKYLFGGTTRQIVYKSLDASTLRNKAISQNLANTMTPGYKRKEVDFEDQLRKIMDQKLTGNTTQSGHIPIGKGMDLSQLQAKAFEPQDEALPGDINNVDIDMEGAKLAENQILYNYLIKFAGFDKFNTAISGRQSGS